MAVEVRKPAVLVPYPGPSDDPRVQDVVVYLRPETNGVDVESAMLRAIQKSPAYKKDLFLVYLANIPGDFIVRNRVVENHYAVKLFFAVHGPRAFTPYMRRLFQDHFGLPVGSASVVGSFEALRLLGLSPDELFHLRVSREHYTILNGQSVKKHGNLFIVNYDIPAVLHKNNRSTDIAAMIFRTYLGYGEFAGLVRDMEQSLLSQGLLRDGTPPSYVFHYSKGPFEQVLDGLGYVYDPDAAHVPVEDLSFCAYLRRNGVDTPMLRGLLGHPIVNVRGAEEPESWLYGYTSGCTFEEARGKLESIVGQVAVPRHF